ncbi:plasmid pRiA4b ORF-3 family protein [Lactobacillus sp. ESL0791]|uniref:plasmid pRiA4b ORF-3 family protein n=1 Tax=Lactobacillus sp. ESL0791 TaxID=2983234 RepID=UPI0023F70A8F|nr:plasmid pRiA4b ORF-3 family protein [Lactobacillus sp. ESL0791]MDF7638957.1 plasmid pRiA4b ORF-3 family protein [Lactobacillus sp. ESL0791]
MMKTRKIYQFRADLNGAKPPIWRRFLIDGDQDMVYLAKALMGMFRMSPGYHLFALKFLNGNKNKQKAIKVKDRAKLDPETQNKLEILDILSSLVGTQDTEYLMPCDTEDGLEMSGRSADEYEPGTTKLAKTGAKIGDKFLLEYDFGDSWEVTVKLEKILSQKSDQIIPTAVIKGKGYGIIEDIGGIWGLMDYKDAAENGEVDEDMQEWLGEEINLADFDLEDINDEMNSVIEDNLDDYYE